MKGFLQSFSVIAILMLGGAVAGYCQAPVVPPGSVINGASFDTTGQPLAAGSLVSIFGTNLAGALAVSDSIPLSNSLSGVSVTINNTVAPLLFVSPGQINAQLPWEVLAVLPPGTNSTATVQIVVANKNGSSAPQAVKVAAVAPGIFTATGSGSGQAIAYGNTDGAYAAPAGAIPGAKSHPAKINDPTTLVVLATGLGPVSPTVKDGDVPPSGSFSSTVSTPTVLVGNVPAQVVFCGLVQYVGVYQINIVIAPGTPTGDAVPLQIQMNGITSRADVTIAVSN